MKQEEKDLLLRDICGRLPYGVKCKYYDCCEGDYDEGAICGFERQEWMQIDGKCIHIEEVKPYLFPVSNMSEEQKKEFNQVIELDLKAICDEIEPTRVTAFEIDFYNKHHIDYRGLIPMGLAIDATGLGIYENVRNQNEK